MEFCTLCDKQCPAGGVYCSEKCRLEDTKKDKDLKRVEKLVPLASVPSDTSVAESQESAEEDSEVPHLYLSGSYKPAAIRKHQKIKKDNQFLYLSPTLKPVKPKTGPSPDMSPLLMPQTKVSADSFAMSQSVNSYRRWLADSA